MGARSSKNRREIDQGVESKICRDGSKPWVERVFIRESGGWESACVLYMEAVT